MADRALDALKAKEDPEFRDRFIKQNKKFILSCAYKTLHRFVTENDDEWMIAMYGFDRAISAYDRDKGSFEAFASLIIKRRLVDYYRTETRFQNEIATEPFVLDGDLDEQEEVTAYQVEVRSKATEQSSGGAGALTVADEIAAMQDVLKGYDFSFFDLTACSPKAQKTKDSCAKAVNVLLGDEELKNRMREKKILPIKEVCEMSNVPRKILERHRKYIIAAVEILDGDYPLMAEYLGYIRSGGT